MFTRSAQLVKLATEGSRGESSDKSKNPDEEILTNLEVSEETGPPESPVPESFKDDLIKMQDLLGDVFHDDDDTLGNEVYVTDAGATAVPSSPPSSRDMCNNDVGLSSKNENIVTNSPTCVIPSQDTSAISTISPVPSPPPSCNNGLELVSKNNEEYASSRITPSQVIVPGAITTPVPSPPPSCDCNDELELANKYNGGNEISSGNITGDVITPVPSPHLSHDSNNMCHNELCTCSENENPPILTNDDLYGNLPTPSVASISSVNTPTSSKCVQTRQSTFKIDKGKKRLLHKENWVVNKRKCAKNKGKSFINSRGKQVQAKELKEPCNEKCRLKCSSKFDEIQRSIIFKKFWALGDRRIQWQFVVRYTRKVPKRRQTTETTKHDRKNTFFYFLSNADGTKMKVCKTMFLNTISAGERIVTTSWKKCEGEVSVSEDKRGKYEHKKIVIDEEMTRSVCDHVKSFSLVESHYVRKNSKKLYLENVNSASRMYVLYAEWFDSEKYRNKANKRQYRDILNANFNIGFHKPKKDLCDVCHIYKNKEIPTEEEKEKYLKHQEAKTAARRLKQLDKDEAKSKEYVLAATFDFEKVLITPHGDVSVFYYKRKLATLNFTVYDLATKRATCFMWHEGLAKRGANEVSSCLYQYIKEHALKGIKVFRFWSDNCAGQNRNRIVFSLYLLAAKEFGVTITHRFMEKGHTQNEGDSVHSTIERASDRKLIYVPEEWYCLVRWAKTEGEPYEVKEMTTPEIMDFKALLLNKNWNKNTHNEKIQWTRLREVTVNAENFDRIEYKYDFEDIPKTIVVLRSGNRNRDRLSREFTIKQAYEGELPISRNKHKDLLDLCKSGIIPNKYHDFYEQLKSVNITEDISDVED